jgi:hypothetical protein
MKKKLLIVGVIILVGVAWWFSPVTVMKNVSADEVASIEVCCGKTGKEFVITDKHDIEFILDNIKSVSLRKTKISLMYAGTSFNLTFKDKDNKTIDKFIIMHATTIRKDPFFYSNDKANLCEDFLGEVEDKIVGNDH